MMGYEEIFKKYSIPINTLKQRRFLLQIKPDGKLGKEVKFSPEQVYQLVNWEVQSRCLKNHPRKLKVIALYQTNKNAKATAQILKMRGQDAFDAIKEFNEGMVTVESSMNRPDLILEKQGNEWYLYDEDENLMASTEQIQSFYLLNRANIEAHLSLRKKVKDRYNVEICTNRDGIPWITNRIITIKTIDPS